MHVVAVGAGFGGVKAALELSKRKVGKITLVANTPYFLHHATVYATATGKSHAESVIPLEAIFANHPQAKIVRDTVTSLDDHRRIIHGSFNRDELVILYPISLFSAMETLLLPLPVFTSNRNYLNAGHMRRSISVVARVIQIAAYSLLAYICALLFAKSLETPTEGGIFAILLTPPVSLLLLFNIVLSVRYIQWLLRNFRSS